MYNVNMYEEAITLSVLFWNAQSIFLWATIMDRLMGAEQGKRILSFMYF